MCGLAFYFARESVPDIEHFDTLFKWAEKRGPDGFGVTIVKRNTSESSLVTKEFSTIESYSAKSDEILKHVEDNLDVGDILLAIGRAAPEQEPPTSERNMQPISTGNCILIHNGSVCKKVYDEVMGQREKENTAENVSDIDSEAIIHAYIQANRNIKKAMERISGGVAAIVYDHIKDMVYMISDFKPLAQAYIKGCGYFLASDNDCLGEIIEDITSCRRDGVCTWENFYHHYLSGARIKELDLDSGFIKNIKYRPRYITQKWDSSQPEEKENVCLVSASGGLDSTLTTSILKMANLNPVACHFKYGHRGQDAEEKAITTVCEQMGVPLKLFDIENLVRGIDSSSMLIDPDAKITTGTDEGLKKLDAWVCGRNMLFLSIMASYAESLVMKENYKNVYLVGGFLNLTESGCIVDCDNNKVLTSDKKYVRPGTLSVGDKLLSFNFDKKELQNTVIKKVFNTTHKRTYKLILSFDEGCIHSKKELLVSSEHPFYVKNKEWVKAEKLKVGDILYSFRECNMSQRAAHNSKFKSKDFKDKISKLHTGRKRSEETKKKISESLKGRERSPEHCKAISESLKGGSVAGNKNPMYGHIRSRTKKCWCGKIHSIAKKEVYSAATKKLWKNPEYVSNVLLGIEKFKESDKYDEYIENMSKRAKRMVEDYIEEHGHHWAQTPEARKKSSETMKKLIQEGTLNPSTLFNNCPNKCEKKLINLFEKTDINLDFVGDGQIWMTSEGKKMNPDFINIDQRVVVEYYGGIGFFHTLEEIDERDRLYNKIGWRHLAIIDSEINDLDSIKTKVIDFLHDVHNGWIVEEIEIIEGQKEMINFHCEPNNNFFVDKILTHNSYPDNSEYFLSSALDHFKYGTLIGDRIKPLFCLSNLMKSDQFELIKAFNLEQIFKNTISCDRPIVDSEGIPRNCSKNGIPACGSGLLSYWASKMVGMDDMSIRNFYEIDEEYEAHVPEHLSEGKILKKDVQKILDRILIPEYNLQILRDLLKI